MLKAYVGDTDMSRRNFRDFQQGKRIYVIAVRSTLRNHVKTILLSSLSALVIGVGSAAAPSFAYLLVASAIAMNVGAYFFSDKLVLRMHGACVLSAAEAQATNVYLSSRRNK
jgi:Zn-dependent protease with chaperone function